MSDVPKMHEIVSAMSRPSVSRAGLAAMTGIDARRIDRIKRKRTMSWEEGRAILRALREIAPHADPS